MIKLEEIGFYTLSDNRAKEVSVNSPLQRCELILTDRCNFNCPYCRGMKDVDKRDLTRGEAFGVVDLWTQHCLKNIRFSGGEPTLWPDLIDLVSYAKQKGINKIALSTNGSHHLDYYIKLFLAGVNDFSISLDSCCASTGNKMAGRKNIWDTIIKNIKVLSTLTYVTVGVVLTKDNYQELNDIVRFASGLGVADIRVIPAAQISTKLSNISVDSTILDKHPILRYRFDNFIINRDVRGLCRTDNSQCPLVLDDMVVLNGRHYPCIIYMREQGEPIGSINHNIKTIRGQRYKWFKNHNCYADSICQRNCLDVCVDYNNKVRQFQTQIQ
jgi:MoaA/NifB/PqqE/SkfB family radical SAM enzyme